VQVAIVALGFPDIIFQSEEAFMRVLAKLTASDADVVLGLFPTDRPEKVDMVGLDDDSRVLHLAIKPRQTHLRYTWGLAVWKPTFTHFLHEHLIAVKTTAKVRPELFVGDVIQAAIDDGLRVEAVHVADTPYLDIGTPEDLVRAVKSSAVHLA
jgi:glucose-1-phosphate thymidylyltransferase